MFLSIPFASTPTVYQKKNSNKYCCLLIRIYMYFFVQGGNATHHIERVQEPQRCERARLCYGRHTLWLPWQRNGGIWCLH